MDDADFWERARAIVSRARHSSTAADLVSVDNPDSVGALAVYLLCARIRPDETPAPDVAPRLPFDPFDGYRWSD